MTTMMVTLSPSLSVAEAQKALQEKENELLESLDPTKLVTVTVDDLKPGLPLFYTLGDSYGCHILRNRNQLPGGYRSTTDFKGGTEAGLFLRYKDDA